MQYDTCVYVLMSCDGRDHNHRLKRAWRSGLMTLLAAGCVLSQAPPGATGPTGTSRAMQLPASGRTAQPGSVAASQSAAEGTGVATVSSSLQVSGDYSGSV